MAASCDASSPGTGLPSKACSERVSHQCETNCIHAVQQHAARYARTCRRSYDHAGVITAIAAGSALARESVSESALRSP